VAADHKDACAAYRAERDAKLKVVAEKTGYPLRTIAWVCGAITFAAGYRRKDEATPHVSAAELCRMLIADLNPRSPAHVREMLESLGIGSSRDVGRIVYELIPVGLCMASESDSMHDFDAVFERETVQQFIIGTGLDRLRDTRAGLATAAVCALYLAAALCMTAGVQLSHQRYWYGLGLGFIAAGWLVSRSRFARRMRFGLPWHTLRPREMTALKRT
jgi:uncharacterized repeat protein (TIGR04138 family)